MRRAAGLAAAGALAATLLAAPPSGVPGLREPSNTIVETGGVSVGRGVQLRLGMPVERLPDGVSLAAYDPASRGGTVQWMTASGAPVLLLVRDGLVRAMSIGHPARFRTSGGVALGDPASSLRTAYGSRLRPAATFPGWVLPSAGGGHTVFDTACTDTVNAIGLAMGDEGLRVLGEFWGPADGADPCAIE